MSSGINKSSTFARKSASHPEKNMVLPCPNDEIKAFIGSELLNYYGVVSFTVNVNKDGYVTSAQYSFYTDVDSTKQVVVKFSYSF